MCVCHAISLLLAQIREIENLTHLYHLRVLNLAGNNITCVSGLTGLQALAELNLRRNRITNVVCVCVCVCGGNGLMSLVYCSTRWMN